ncbi:MAG: hypothetical protein HQM09_22090 [Candidatus Riflebacteria bacterium]|nr:hypothetical protein [Candidatus Riflebacteria bacterium]
MAEDNQGRLWAGTFGAGLLLFDGKEWSHIASAPNGLPDNRLSKLLVDNDALYVATAGGGAVRYDFSTHVWTPVGTGEQLTSHHFHAFLRLPDGRFILGSVGDGLFIGRDTDWKHFSESDGLPSSWVNDAVIGSEGVFLATADGLALLKNDRIVEVDLPQDAWQDGATNVITRFRDEWFLGTSSGGLIARSIDEKAVQAGVPAWKTRHYRRIPGISGSVHALLPDGDTLWVAAEAGLFRISGVGDPVRIDGPWGRSEAFKCLLKRRDGHLYVGTAEGCIYSMSTSGEWKKIYDYTNSSLEVMK